MKNVERPELKPFLRAAYLKPVPEDLWSGSARRPPHECWLSGKFLVQVYRDRGFDRITVSRVKRGSGGQWVESITWEELMACKRQIGRGDSWAVECFPADDDVVNEANMRHLWLLAERPEFGWKTPTPSQQQSGEQA